MESIFERIRCFAARNHRDGRGGQHRGIRAECNVDGGAYDQENSGRGGGGGGARKNVFKIEQQSMGRADEGAEEKDEEEDELDGERTRRRPSSNQRPVKLNQKPDNGPDEKNANGHHDQQPAEFGKVAVAAAASGGDKEAAPCDCLTPMTRSRLNTLAQIGEDWLYLALLGIIMALLSLSMDSVITVFLGTRIWLSEEMSEQNWLLQYLAWCITPILLVTFSTGFVHLCSPTAIGSGIPEMKTILRGVVLNEYLTFRTLIAKIVGLTFTLGSGLPLGKEGPSVHMASIVATLLSKLVASFQGIYENESRTSEMLSAACAVGVAATFYAPIGGVLFSIEVTTVYFAVRNYWRGFFAACCGATIWRLLGFYIKNDESISAIFKTNFSTDYPFDPIELLVFSFIGATCGLAGAAYIKFHREIVQFFRRHKRISGFLKQNRFVYPTLVTLIITTSTFPPLLGRYTAATLSTHTTIEHLFSNRTWSLGSQDLVSKRILDHWTTEHTNFYLHLVLYIVMLFWTSALASTIPTPSGVFIPVVKMGAAYGRLIGELMASAYPNGIKYSHPAAIVPGSYAVVGAAAFSGAVTHTVSTSVILFEMTGQIVHIIPVILGVLISNAVCQSLQPSIYDSIIEIKKLPYLPPIASSNSISHRILVKDFMNTSIPFVWKERCSYSDLKSLLSTHRKIISFPLVESPHSMKLLGSVARPDLLKLLYLHLGRERRLQEVCRRNSDTLTPAIYLLNTISGKLAEANAANPNDELTLKLESKAQLEHQVSSLDIVNNNNNNNNDKPDDSDDGGIEFKRLKGCESDLKSKSKSCELGQEPNSAINKSLALQDIDLSIRERILERNLNTDSGDCDATRLIISATKTSLHNYGATDEQKDRNQMVLPPQSPPQPQPGSMGAARQLRLGEEQLLSECQKDVLAHEEEEYKHFHGVAKIINHYDRGSSMDEDHLDKSIQGIEGHLAKVVCQRQPEIVVVVSQEPQEAINGDDEDKMSQPNGEPPPKHEAAADRKTSETISTSSSELSQVNDERRHRNSLVAKPSQPVPISGRQGSRRLTAAPSFSHTPTSASPRPTKSILKTSSFNSPTSLLSKRMMISPSHSFTNSYESQVKLNQRGHQSLNPTNTIKFTLTPEQQANNNNNNNNNQTTQRADNDLLLGTDQRRLDKQQQPQDKSDQPPTGLSSSSPPPPVRQRRKVRLPRLRVVDMTPEEQEQWEKEQLNAHIDITRCQIDEAPFQLVEQTSLYRVHTLFSMLGLNHAYVTSFGRLVGIVALKDIRYAIEKMLQEK